MAPGDHQPLGKLHPPAAYWATRVGDMHDVRYHFFVCVNERPAGSPLPSCAPAGGRALYQEFVREIARRGYPAGVKVTSTSCLTPCQCGPNIVVYPEGAWYAGVTLADIPEILDSHLLHGRPLARLLLPSDIRVV